MKRATKVISSRGKGKEELASTRADRALQTASGPKRGQFPNKPNRRGQSLRKGPSANLVSAEGSKKPRVRALRKSKAEGQGSEYETLCLAAKSVASGLSFLEFLRYSQGRHPCVSRTIRTRKEAQFFAGLVEDALYLLPETCGAVLLRIARQMKTEFRGLKLPRDKIYQTARRGGSRKG